MSNRVKAMVQWNRVTEIEKEKKKFQYTNITTAHAVKQVELFQIGFYGMLSRTREPNFNFSLKMET